MGPIFTNLYVKMPEQLIATREQKAKQRLANRAKRKNLKVKQNISTSSTKDEQNVSLPEITTKITAFKSDQSDKRKKSKNSKSHNSRISPDRYSNRHASPSSSTSSRNNMQTFRKSTSRSSDSVFSSSSIDLISSNETLNHENEVFKSNLDPIVENSQNSTKNRKTSVITSKIEIFENIMRNSSSSV